MGPGCRLEKRTRESTPCSLIRDSNAVDTLGSTTRQRTSSFRNQNQRTHEHMQRNIPTAYEMEQFFAYAEKQQQTIFLD
ncbi:Cyclin-dependent kinase inhibitor 3, partial [Mucuna pruriens]